MYELTLAYINSKSFPNFSKNVETILEQLNVELFSKHLYNCIAQQGCLQICENHRHLVLSLARNDDRAMRRSGY